MIVGTAGHIDHGKTALVRALTGVETDRLAAEKARGITIELGFAYADLGDGGITGFVDMPGHERLVHTMVAGAGGIDLALLVVAASEGVMPQTREHLAILRLLGIPRGIVVLSKADLVDHARLAEVEAALRPLLPWPEAEVLPVSALTGAGLPELRAALAREAAASAARGAEGRLQVILDRSFTLPGAGTVVTGILASGRLEEGQSLVISPSGREARLRGLRVQGRPARSAAAGSRVALNLAGLAREDVRRGDVALAPGDHAPTMRVDVALDWDAPPGPRSGERARLHVGAADAIARIVPLAPGLAQLVLDTPLALRARQRFILRDLEGRATLGGGRLLDLRPPARRRATPERLAALGAEDLRERLKIPPQFVDLQSYLRDEGLASVDLSGIEVIGGQALLAPVAAGLRADLLAHLAAFHEAEPEMQGPPRERLRLALRPRLPPAAFAELLRGMELRLEGGFVALPDHAPRLAPEDEALWTRLAPGLGGDARFRPPRVRDLAGTHGVEEGEVRRVLRLAARQGRVDQIARDHFFLRATVAEMVGLARDVQAQAADGWITAAAFRDRMDNGRKVAIEILDFFDRNGVTVRRGDLRRINPPRMDLFGPAPP